LSALVTPVFGVIGFLAFWVFNSTVKLLQVLPYVVAAPVVGFVAVFLFLWGIDRLGRKNYSLPTLPMFKAFLTNWVTGLNGPLEKHLEELGEDADIEVNLLKFDSAKPKAAFIMPLVHPGPFKNIGSSLLPSMLKGNYEREFGCNAATLLGILGHELDLASQTQNRRIVTQVLISAKFQASVALATPLVKATEGAASASCQIFGETALLSFSLAPKTTEDMPQELGCAVDEEAKKLGLKFAMVVNAHNSLNDIIDTDEHLAELKVAASKCLNIAVTQKKAPLRVGAATVYPRDFSLKDGMGTGGITAIVVEVEGQKTAYVVIDGNNMVSGLREKILASLTALGFAESEVFTTDTHAVSALSTGRRGYHPVGEAMDHAVLIRYIGEAAKQAISSLEPAKAGFTRFVVPQVRVIGEERLNSVSLLVDKAIDRAKKIALPIFGAEGLALILLLMLF
jgi:putative membrane protein